MLGDFISSAVSVWNAEKNRDAAYESQSRSQDFSERMAKTQYQNMVTDLNAAGLSPMLAYHNKAAAPSGSPVTGTSSIEAPKFGETSARQAQTELAKEQANVAQTTAQVNAASADKIRAETMNINQDTENKRLYPGMNDAQIRELLARIPQHGASAQQLQELAKHTTQQINLHKPAEQFKQENPNVAKYMSPIQDSLRTIFEGLGLLRGSSAMPFVTKNAPKGK
jgi:hypothetical protein